MNVDAHQHFWRYDPREYAWIDERMRVLERDFLPGDLEPLIRSQGIDRTIAVQACQTSSETEWLLELAAANPFIAGVIGWVDLQADDVEARVERAARNRKLVGVRHVVQSEPDDGFLLRPAFGRGIATLARHGLVYDLLIYPRHLPIASDFVGRFDSQTFVLDHLAKPDIREPGDRRLGPRPPPARAASARLVQDLRASSPRRTGNAGRPVISSRISTSRSTVSARHGSSPGPTGRSVRSRAITRVRWRCCATTWRAARPPSGTRCSAGMRSGCGSGPHFDIVAFLTSWLPPRCAKAPADPP